ncbi:NYN domain-containing protein [Scytonema sp. UIC 10036]|nr:NYN domain-containing protein [Scytonema sp. UIC 10036]
MKKSHQQTLVGIYWDTQNVSLSSEQAVNLLDFGKTQGSVIRKKAYCNSMFENQAVAMRQLQNIGFYCDDITCVVKNSADNQLKSDLIDDIYHQQSSDVIILVSGDGDFVNPLKFLKEKGKKIIIFAHKGNVKKKLMDAADETYFVDKLPQIVNVHHLENSNESHIQYTEAVNCLIKAVKTVSSQGKQTKLSTIDNAMRQLLPKYKGVACICKPDGGKFSSFSKFIEAVEKDGKIRMREQNLFLIE